MARGQAAHPPLSQGTFEISQGVTMFDMPAFFLFPFLMALAAVSDLFTMRISNKLILVLIAGFAVVALLMGLPLDQLGMHLGVGVAVLLVTLVLFSLGWIGGGDAKLAAAISLWLGLGLTLPFLVYAALFGGILTLIVLGMRALPLPQPLATVGWVQRLHNANNGVPYGIALAIGGLVVYGQSPIFAHFSV